MRPNSKLLICSSCFLLLSDRFALPAEVIKEYFTAQEHFSLKRLLSRHCTSQNGDSKFLVIHTRSDQFIHSLSVDEASVIRKLVHEDLHAITI
jgi:hypothetical protein